MSAEFTIMPGIQNPASASMIFTHIRSGGQILRRFYRGFMAIKSVVIGVLILFLWARSYAVGDMFARGSDAQRIGIGSAVGVMIVQFVHDGQPTKLDGDWHRDAAAQPREVLENAGMGDSFANLLGFGFNHHRVPPPGQGMVVNFMLPHWLMFMLAIPSAIMWMVRRSRAKSKAEAQAKVFVWCPRCVREVGVVAEQCPECGGPVGVQETDTQYSSVRLSR